jgi:hypothetical protein
MQCEERIAAMTSQNEPTIDPVRVCEFMEKLLWEGLSEDKQKEKEEGELLAALSPEQLEYVVRAMRRGEIPTGDALLLRKAAARTAARKAGRCEREANARSARR